MQQPINRFPAVQNQRHAPIGTSPRLTGCAQWFAFVMLFCMRRPLLWTQQLGWSSQFVICLSTPRSSFQSPPSLLVTTLQLRFNVGWSRWKGIPGALASCKDPHTISSLVLDSLHLVVCLVFIDDDVAFNHCFTMQRGETRALQLGEAYCALRA